MSEPNQSLEEFLFQGALAKSSEAEGAAFLDGVCRDNPALRARLEVLLEGHFQAECFLKVSTKNVEEKPARLPVEDESASIWIGRYKLLEKIGEGPNRRLDADVTRAIWSLPKVDQILAQLGLNP